jgi:hypothetical protein
MSSPRNRDTTQMRRGEGVAAGKRLGGDAPAVHHFRVEIWRVDKPEIRLAQFPLEYSHGNYKAADWLWKIANHLILWMDSHVKPHNRPLCDVPLHESVWLEENRYHGSKTPEKEIAKRAKRKC